MGARSHQSTGAGTIHLVRKLVSEAGAWEAVGGGPSVRSRLCDPFISNQVDFCPVVLLLKAGEIMPIFVSWLEQGSCEVRALFLNPSLPCPELAWAGTGRV